jgi:hypothetical protein
MLWLGDEVEAWLRAGANSDATWKNQRAQAGKSGMKPPQRLRVAESA